MRITVYGAGSWGTALACMLDENGHQVCLWSWLKEDVETMLASRINQFLPNIHIPESITISNDYAIGKGAELVVFATPSHALHSVAQAAAPYIEPAAIIVNVAKGFAPDSLQRLSQTIKEFLPNNPVLTLSGPSHAEEVSRKLPTTVAIAGDDLPLLQQMQDVFMNKYFRVYPNTDQLGVEICGAVKNIIALGCGILSGMELGDNARAALMTRGLAEMKRLGIAMGAKPATFSGLAGVGDLIVTCTSIHSRNFRAGLEIGRGKPWKDVIASSQMVVEGVNATNTTHALAKQHGVEMPITEQIYQILHNDRPPIEAMNQLMTREKTTEE